MSAVISACGQYRYELRRSSPNPPATCLNPWQTCVFIMLNPSTADAEKDDPTIRRCRTFAQRLGCGKLVVVNIFAYRSSSPKVLKSVPDPYGPENKHYLDLHLSDPTSIKIAAWGTNGLAELEGDRIAKKYGPLKCLGTNKSGSPKHPLYVHGRAPLIDWKNF